MSRPVSTNDVRPIADVIAELRRLFIAKLPTRDPGTMACWSVLNECAELIEIARDAREEQYDRTDVGMQRYLAGKAGEHYVAAMNVRRIADAYGVPNFREGS